MKKQTIIVGAGAFVVGILLALGIGFYSMPSFMMLEDESPHDFATTTEVFEQEVTAAGWKVLTAHDMQAKLAGFGHDVDAVKIYELCSSKYSAEILALDDERIASPLMPCRGAIYEKSNGRTYIGRMNSNLMAKPFGGVISDVMEVAAAETEVVIEKVIN
jgi:uncharacterized protein (DUF302 family)